VRGLIQEATELKKILLAIIENQSNKANFFCVWIFKICDLFVICFL